MFPWASQYILPASDAGAVLQTDHSIFQPFNLPNGCHKAQPDIEGLKGHLSLRPVRV